MRPKLQVSISAPSPTAVVSLKRGRAELDLSASELDFLANLNTILSCSTEENTTDEPTILEVLAADATSVG